MFEIYIDFFLYLLYILLIYSSCAVIYTANPVYSICYLIICFISSALLILFLGSQLLAFIFLMIYVGAILVLFVFIIMMLNIKKMEMDIPLNRSLSNGISALIVSYVYYEIIMKFLSFFDFRILNYSTPKDNYINFLSSSSSKHFLEKSFNLSGLKKSIQFYSDILYIDYFLMFWMGGMLLLLAMVGAIIISLNKSISIYRQNAFSQINKNEKNSLFLFKNNLNKKKWKNWVDSNLKKILRD